MLSLCEDHMIRMKLTEFEVNLIISSLGYSYRYFYSKKQHEKAEKHNELIEKLKNFRSNLLYENEKTEN